MLNNKKGIAMLIVISLILMLLILGGAALMLSTGHFGTSFQQIKRARAFYAAEAAMQHVLWALRTGNSTALPADFEINGIEDDDIAIDVETAPGGSRIAGVQYIDITVNY